MYLSDKQRGKCLEAVAANYEIKRENRAKLKIRLIGLYRWHKKNFLSTFLLTEKNVVTSFIVLHISDNSVQ